MHLGVCVAIDIQFAFLLLCGSLFVLAVSVTSLALAQQAHSAPSSVAVMYWQLLADSDSVSHRACVKPTDRPTAGVTSFDIFCDFCATSSSWNCLELDHRHHFYSSAQVYVCAAGEIVNAVLQFFVVVFFSVCRVRCHLLCFYSIVNRSQALKLHYELIKFHQDHC